ncbi:MAG TPA: site-2 protease family protein [Kofleriaceae bacterium]|jgi:membrane-associated protease RseP (regulator of RpoE activity)|nr:site-2 protease family protein [Kofleriaceae bacterium]
MAAAGDSIAEPAPTAASARLAPKDLAIHVGLFAATCATTYLAGGAAFAATLMTILVCHEMGHYLMARRYRLDVSLPYFIPLPPMISLGTLGAVIRMRAPIEDRKALIDVGAAGPIAGLVVAIPALAIGLSLSTVGPPLPEGITEGNSILYGVIKLTMFGRWLPGGGVDVQLHPMAFAAWVGLLVTMINLIPIGQLDGGHVMRAWLDDRHERVSAVLHRGLGVVAVVAGAGLYTTAVGAGAGTRAALGYAAYGVMPWLVWALALYAMRQVGDGVYHPPVAGPPLSPGRRALALAMIVVFVLLFVPVPMRPTL